MEIVVLLDLKCWRASISKNITWKLGFQKHVKYIQISINYEENLKKQSYTH